jgi:hypothetical protein
VIAAMIRVVAFGKVRDVGGARLESGSVVAHVAPLPAVPGGRCTDKGDEGEVRDVGGVGALPASSRCPRCPTAVGAT